MVLNSSWSIYSRCCWSVSYTVLYLNPVRPKNVWPLNILSEHGRHLRRRSFSHPRKKGATKVFKHWPKRPWVPTQSPDHFQTVKQMLAPDWVQKNPLYYCSQSANSIPWVIFVCSYTTAIVSSYLQRNEQSQETFSLIKTPSIQNTLYTKTKTWKRMQGILKTLLQKYKLELTTPIKLA